jgi:hypothetical protein
MVKTYFKDGMRLTSKELREKIFPLINKGIIKDLNEVWNNTGCLMVYEAYSAFLGDTDGKVYKVSAWASPGSKASYAEVKLMMKNPQEQWSFEDLKYVNEKLELLAEGRSKIVSFNFYYSAYVRLLETKTVSFTMLGTRYYVYNKLVYKAGNESLHFVNPLNRFVAELDTVVRTLDNIKTRL